MGAGVRAPAPSLLISAGSPVKAGRGAGACPRRQAGWERKAKARKKAGLLPCPRACLSCLAGALAEHGDGKAPRRMPRGLKGRGACLACWLARLEPEASQA